MKKPFVIIILLVVAFMSGFWVASSRETEMAAVFVDGPGEPPGDGLSLAEPRDDAFYKTDDQMARDCSGELVNTRCEGYPCMALLRIPDDDKWLRKLQKTDAWSEAYDNVISSWETEVTCDNGRKEKIALMAKSWDGQSDTTKLHTQKRHGPRGDAIIKNWKCRGE